MSNEHAIEAGCRMKGISMEKKQGDRLPPILDQLSDIGAVEYILKIPRSLDLRVANMINERHQQFVEEELRYLSCALKDAERLSSEYKHASRRSREGAQENNERP